MGLGLTPTCACFAVRWAANFKQWIDTSHNSHSEAKATNNHGTWHDILSLALSLYTSDAAGASRVCSDFLEKRIAVQVQPAGAEVKHGGPDAGALPREDGRTNSQSYHRCRSLSTCHRALLPTQPSERSWLWSAWTRMAC